MPRTAAFLAFIAAGHTSVMALFFNTNLKAMILEGWVHSVRGDVHRAADFFSLFFGFALLTAAFAARRSALGPWCLLALAITGAAAMPMGGFWLAIPAAWVWKKELEKCEAGSRAHASAG